MLRHIAILFLTISLMSCENEPIGLTEPIVDDTITIFYQGYNDTDTSTGIIYFEYYAWDTNLMSFYNEQWQLTNPISSDQGSWLTWAVINAEPIFLIISEDVIQSEDWEMYNADYYYLNTNLSDHITNGDTVITL